MQDTIVNKIAESGIITLNLEELLPATADSMVFDLKPFLFREMILREKEFRAALEEHDWSVYQDKVVSLTCTADAIIPMWAYMLVAAKLQPVVQEVFTGTVAATRDQLLLRAIERIDARDYTDKRVVIKGCGDQPLPSAAFAAITYKLLPEVKSLMYGEPCSTVPVYKKKKNATQ